MTRTLNPANEKSMKKGADEQQWAKAKKRNAGNRNGSKGESMADIERLIAGKKWKKARALIQEELISAPADHWLWMHLGLTYYEEKCYEQAAACSKRAVELRPNCPLALWHYAGSLFMNGNEQGALIIWTILLDMDLEEVAYAECGEGMDWALQLVNDVHYRMGRYFQWKGQESLARVSFEKYLHNREHGVSSLYDKDQVMHQLRLLSPASQG
jgi:tetratricopeptide (TPR) repeat protein